MSNRLVYMAGLSLLVTSCTTTGSGLDTAEVETGSPVHCADSPRHERPPLARYVIDSPQARSLLDASAVDAVSEIARRAAATRMVILNENHSNPHHRAFALQVARALRPLGYNVLAVETLANSADDAIHDRNMSRIAARGYVTERDGTYLREPVFADFLRQSIAAGYRLVAYEQTRRDGPSDPEEDIAVREQDQADYLSRRVFRADTDKVLVYVGLSHVTERPLRSTSGAMRRWLATRVKERTGIDPLTIDQVTVDESSPYAANVDLMKLLDRKGLKRPSVLKSGQGPIVVVGPYAGAVDLQVFSPVTSFAYGRPAWLLEIGRKPVAIPARLHPPSGRRLLQAIVAGEGSGSIAVDQVEIGAATGNQRLMLPRGKFRYVLRDCRGWKG